MMRHAFVRVVALLLALAVGGCGGGGGSDADDAGGGTLPTATITLIGATGARLELTVEVARTAAERSHGLMFRDDLAEERGMLFVYQRETKVGFWMKNTKIPLSIAFIAADGTILETKEMKPLSNALNAPARAYRYALEVNRGWFERHGLGSGDRVEIPADAGRE